MRCDIYSTRAFTGTTKIPKTSDCYLDYFNIVCSSFLETAFNLSFVMFIPGFEFWNRCNQCHIIVYTIYFDHCYKLSHLKQIHTSVQYIARLLMRDILEPTVDVKEQNKKWHLGDVTNYDVNVHISIR